MKTELIDEASGVAELKSKLQPSAFSIQHYPKVRLMEAVLTVAIIAALAIYAACGALLVYHQIF